jgi:ribonuclease HII
MVMVGFAADERLIDTFKKAGVKDSKKVSAKKREQLYPFLMRRGMMVVKTISPQEIDRYVSKQVQGKNLNSLEALYMSRIIEELKADKIYIDCPSTNIPRFENEVFQLLKPETQKAVACSDTLIFENHADTNHIIVGAASIIAKVRRDKILSELSQKYGPIGTGYPSDPKTRAFLIDYALKNGIPDWCRKSWKSWDRWLKVGEAISQQATLA